MVARLLGLDAAPKPADAADALALAICHLWRGDSSARLAAAAAAAPKPRIPRTARGRPPRPAPGRRVAGRGRPMIAFVRGPVAAVGAGSAVVEVGGVGLELQCAPAHPGRAAARARAPPSPPRWSSARTR